MTEQIRDINSFSRKLLLGVLNQLKGHVKTTAIGVSLIKGLHVGYDGPVLLSHMIKSELSLYNDVAVVMGANVASEVAMVMLCCLRKTLLIKYLSVISRIS